jgi:hypothetical protein
MRDTGSRTTAKACLLRASFEDETGGPGPYPGHHCRSGLGGVACHQVTRTRVRVLTRERA